MTSKNTPTRTIRLSDHLWDALDAAARAAGKDRTSVIRELIEWYTKQPHAPLPARGTAMSRPKLYDQVRDKSKLWAPITHT